MLTIIPVDHVWIRIDADLAILQELHDYFTFEPTNAKFMRRGRFRGWNGKIHIFRLKDRRIYRGLLHRIIEFAEARSYEYDNQVSTPRPIIDDNKLHAWIATQHLNMPARDYQLDALKYCLSYHRGIIISPTGSGKSYIIYLLMLALHTPRLLVVVPTIGLVHQMITDFRSYGWGDDIHAIHGGCAKETTARIVVATWQSIYKLDQSYLQQFTACVCDEVHLANASSLRSLFEKINCKFRFGFTGTLTETQCHRLILEGLFGPVHQVTTTAKLMQKDQLAQLHVKICALDYPEQARKNLRHATYQEEVDYLVSDPARTEFIAHLVQTFKGNTLVLFNLIDRHGKALFERIQTVCPDKQVHFVTGATSADDREDVRNTVEDTTDQDQVIVASTGVFSTGVNIRRLHHIVFAYPGKSKIRTLQSIGRGLRLHSTKSKVTIYDVVDDLRIGRHLNYALKHAHERSTLYAAEQFKVTLHPVKLTHFTQKGVSDRLGDGSGGPETSGQGSLL